MKTHRPGLFLFLAALVMLTLSASPGWAHTGHGTHGGWTQGMGHPWSGWDHLLAMLAVGLWAAQLGGRARWALPGAFVGTMALGSLLGVARLAVPGTEAALLGSVFILGALVVAWLRMPLAAAVALVAVAGGFHGLAHGLEMPASASTPAYALGFLLSTAVLHAAGLAYASAALKLQAGVVVRGAGLMVLLFGVLLA